MLSIPIASKSRSSAEPPVVKRICQEIVDLALQLWWRWRCCSFFCLHVLRPFIDPVVWAQTGNRRRHRKIQNNAILNASLKLTTAECPAYLERDDLFAG